MTITAHASSSFYFFFSAVAEIVWAAVETAVDVAVN